MPQPSRHVTARISFRKGTTAEWLASDPVLMAAEPAVDTSENKLKIGNGTDKWSELSYVENFGTDLDASLIDYATKVSLQSTDDTLRSLIDLRATQVDLESTEDALTDLINLRATKVSLQSTEDALTDLINLRATGSYQDFLNGYGSPVTNNSGGGTGGGTNSSPTGSVLIDDTTPLTGSTLTVSNTASDADGTGSITYTWKSNGTTVGTGETYFVEDSDLGNAITVEASYIDGAGNLEVVSSSATSIVATTTATFPAGIPNSSILGWWDASDSGFRTTVPSSATFVVRSPNITYDPLDVYSYISEQSLIDAGESTTAAGYYKLQTDGLNKVESDQTAWWVKYYNADGTISTASLPFRWVYYANVLTAQQYTEKNLGLSNLSTVDNSNNISRIILGTLIPHIPSSGVEGPEAVFRSTLVSSDRYVIQ